MNRIFAELTGTVLGLEEVEKLMVIGGDSASPSSGVPTNLFVTIPGHVTLIAAYRVVG